jgi:hypothetical protein
MKRNIFVVDRLVTTLAFQGFVLSLLCNLCVGFFLGGGLFLALEDEPTTRSVFVAIMAMFASAGILMLAFFVLVGTLSTTARIRIIAQEEFTITAKEPESDKKGNEV